MLERPIAGMALQSVAGMAQGQSGQQGIPFLLGQHAGGGDRRAATITPHQGGLGSGPRPQGQHPIHQQQQGRPGQPLQRPQHRPFGGQAQTPAVDFTGAGLPQGPGQRVLAQQGNQGLPASGRQSLAVVQTCRHQGSEGRRRQHHGRREHRPKQAAPADFVDPGAGGGIEPSPDRRLGAPEGVRTVRISPRQRNGAGDDAVRWPHWWPPRPPPEPGPRPVWPCQGNDGWAAPR